MFTLLKLAAAGCIGFAMLGSPRADSCTCKADANAFSKVPHAEDCECKAKTDTRAWQLPHAEDCECKAKT